MMRNFKKKKNFIFISILRIQNYKIDIVKNYRDTILGDAQADKAKRTLLSNVYNYLVANQADNSEFEFGFVQEPFSRLKKLSLGTHKDINLLSLSTDVRNTLLGDHTNIDLVNCHPTIVLCLLEKFEIKVQHDYLRLYVFNRTKLCADLNLTKDQLKQAI